MRFPVVGQAFQPAYPEMVGWKACPTKATCPRSQAGARERHGLHIVCVN